MITLRSNQSEPINKAIAFFNEKKPKPSLIVLPTAWGNVAPATEGPGYEVLHG
mgnify:CR=1 FL=1